MSRKALFIVCASVLVTLASSFGVASYAFGSSEPPQLRPQLPASALPTFSLDQATSVKINDLIGAPGIARFGITTASYTQVRRLADTSIGTFYLIPGSKGACIVGPAGAACGDPGAPGQKMIALVQAVPASDAMVGAGIATAATKRVEIKQTGSRAVLLPVVHGVFVLGARGGVKPAPGVRIQFIAH
jgi:hypothetical protein